MAANETLDICKQALMQQHTHQQSRCSGWQHQDLDDTRNHRQMRSIGPEYGVRGSDAGRWETRQHLENGASDVNAGP